MIEVRYQTCAGSTGIDRTRGFPTDPDRGRAVWNRTNWDKLSGTGPVGYRGADARGCRASRDADHILTDLRSRFDDILEQSEYNNLESRWHDWDEVRAVCARAATLVFDRRCDLDEPATPNA